MDCSVLAVEYGFEGWHSVQFNFIYTVDRGEGEERIEVC